MVPRDRIELSTPAFLWHQENEQKQDVTRIRRCRKWHLVLSKVNELQSQVH